MGSGGVVLRSGKERLPLVSREEGLEFQSEASVDVSKKKDHQHHPCYCPENGGQRQVDNG